MSLPPNPSSVPSDRGSEADRTGTLLERYVTADTSRPLDPDIQAFAIAHPALIRAVEVLRASWREDLARDPKQAPVPRMDADAEVRLPRGDERSTPLGVRLPWFGTGAVRLGNDSLPWGGRTLRRGLWPTIIVVLLLCVGIYLKTPVARTSVGRAHTYTTQTGQRASIRLRDGTHVILGPRTSLIVDAEFGNRNREVTLTGQARFDVTHAAPRPFLVRTGSIITRVLGTDFMVRHYLGDPDVLVAVQAGKVTTGRRTPVILTGNMVARITDSTAAVSAGVDPRKYMEWIEGRYVFTNVPVAEVMAELGRWYGLTFHFSDRTLADRTLTGALDERYPREEVLQNLQIMLGVRMTFQGNIVTLVPAQAPRTRPMSRTVPDDMLQARTEEGR